MEIPNVTLIRQDLRVALTVIKTQVNLMEDFVIMVKVHARHVMEMVVFKLKNAFRFRHF